jgi:hypothetical protein
VSNHDPLDQLSRLRIEADPTTRANHLDAIDAELLRRPASRAGRGRRWTLGVVVAMLLAGPVAAVAGDRAVPGDLLYPVKHVLEPIVRLFDEDVVAEHRVEEVGELVRRGSGDAVIEEQVTAARDALADTDAPELERELDRIVDRWSVDRQSAEPGVTDAIRSTTTVPGDASRREPTDLEERPTDPPPPLTTTTISRDQPIDSAPPPSDGTTTTSTAAPAGDAVRTPPDDRP